MTSRCGGPLSGLEEQVRGAGASDAAGGLTMLFISLAFEVILTAILLVGANVCARVAANSAHRPELCVAALSACGLGLLSLQVVGPWVLAVQFLVLSAALLLWCVRPG